MVNELANFTGEANTNYFGQTSATADLNKDGYLDIIAGAYGYNSNQGRVYIFYGGSTLTNKSAASADVILTGEANSMFGYTVSTADINKDGWQEWLVGFQGYPLGNNQGKIYVYQLAHPTPTSQSLTGLFA